MLAPLAHETATFLRPARSSATIARSPRERMRPLCAITRIVGATIPGWNLKKTGIAHWIVGAAPDGSVSIVVVHNIVPLVAMMPVP
ncbi:MAG: hypothetical protein NVS3B16_19290 [Vulcanimicrobiaceae bacterium]